MSLFAYPFNMQINYLVVENCLSVCRLNTKDVYQRKVVDSSASGAYGGCGGGLIDEGQGHRSPMFE